MEANENDVMRALIGLNIGPVRIWKHTDGLFLGDIRTWSGDEFIGPPWESQGSLLALLMELIQRATRKITADANT